MRGHEEEKLLEIDKETTQQRKFYMPSVTQSYIQKDTNEAQQTASSSEHITATTSITPTDDIPAYLQHCVDQQEQWFQFAAKNIMKFHFVTLTDEQKNMRAVQDKEIEAVELTFLETDAAACKSISIKPQIKVKNYWIPLIRPTTCLCCT